MSVKTLADLRTAVNNDVKTNGVRAITGAVLNTQLIDIIDSLESDYVSKDAPLDARLTSLENMTFVVLQDPLTGWDASTGSFPGGGTAKTGYKWEVTTAGTVDGIEFDNGDFIMAINNNASTTTYAGNWVKEDANDKVRSVRGQIGDVTVVPIVNSVASNPTVNDDSNAGYLVGDIWVNTSTGAFYVVNDVTVGAAVWKKKIDEAPNDGNQYARKNEAWDVVAAGTNFADVIYVDSENGDNTSGEIGNSSKPFLTPEGVMANVTNTGTITGNTATSITISGISDAHNADLKIGQWLSGSGVSYGTIIVAKGNEGGNANTITLNKPTTSTVGGNTITWYTMYLVVCSGNFTLIGVTEPNGNLYVDGFCYDFQNSQIIINNWVPFYGYSQRHTPFIVKGGYWFGKGGNSYFYGAQVNSFHDIIIDIHRFESNTTFNGITLGGDGIQKYRTLKVTCPYWYVPFGRISTTEGQNNSYTEFNFGYAYGALGGITYRYGVTSVNGYIETPAAINAVQQVSNAGQVNIDATIVGSCSLVECRVKGYISGTTVTITGGFFSNNSINAHIIANVVVTGNANGGCCEFLGFIRGNLTNTDARVSVSRMYGNYTGNGSSYGKITISQLELAGNSITLNGTSELILENFDKVAGGSLGLNINDTSKLFNLGYYKGVISSLAGELQNFGEMDLQYKSAAIVGVFINRGKIKLENNLIENVTNTPTIDISTGTMICDGGEIVCDNALSLSGLIRKTANGGKLILKGGVYLKTANGLAPLQILSNVGTAQDIMVFDAVTNSAVGFGLLDTFSDVTYGTAYAPNDIAGGQLLQNTNFDF